MLPMSTAVGCAHCPGQAPVHQAATLVPDDLSLALPQSFPATGTGPVQDASATDKTHFDPNTKLSALTADDYRIQTRCRKTDQAPLSPAPGSKESLSACACPSSPQQDTRRHL